MRRDYLNLEMEICLRQISMAKATCGQPRRRTLAGLTDRGRNYVRKAEPRNESSRARADGGSASRRRQDASFGSLRREKGVIYSGGPAGGKSPNSRSDVRI